MDRDRYFKALKVAFASEFSFYLKSSFCHWNVTGVNFPQLHSLFGDIYEDVIGIIDDFAENIRKTGTYTPGSLSKFSMITEIDDANELLSDREMLEVLLADSEKMAQIFKITFDMAEANGDHGLSDFLAARQDAHKKYSWMLRSTLL